MAQDKKAPLSDVNGLQRMLKRKNQEHGALPAPVLKKQRAEEKKTPAPEATSPLDGVKPPGPDERGHDVGILDRLSDPFNKHMTPETRQKLRANLLTGAALTTAGTAGVTAGASVIGFFSSVLGLAVVVGVVKGYRDEGPAHAVRKVTRENFLSDHYTLSEGPPILRQKKAASDGGKGGGAPSR